MFESIVYWVNCFTHTLELLDSFMITEHLSFLDISIDLMVMSYIFHLIARLIKREETIQVSNFARKRGF